MSMYEKLPVKEQQIVKIVTIISVIFLVYLFFIKQKIITAMLFGGFLLILQQVYLRLRTKNYGKGVR